MGGRRGVRRIGLEGGGGGVCVRVYSSMHAFISFPCYPVYSYVKHCVKHTASTSTTSLYVPCIVLSTSLFSLRQTLCKHTASTSTTSLYSSTYRALFSSPPRSAVNAAGPSTISVIPSSQGGRSSFVCPGSNGNGTTLAWTLYLRDAICKGDKHYSISGVCGGGDTCVSALRRSFPRQHTHTHTHTNTLFT